MLLLLLKLLICSDSLKFATQVVQESANAFAPATPILSRTLKGASSQQLSYAFFARPAEQVTPEFIGCLLVESPAAPTGIAPTEEKSLPEYLSIL